MSQRFSIVLIVLAVTAGLITIDRGLDDGDGEPAGVRAIGPAEFPMASDPDSLASTWFCAGGTATVNEPFANHIIDVFNPTDAAIDVTVSVYEGTIAPPVEQVDPDEIGDDDAADDAGDDEGSDDAADEGDGGSDQDNDGAPHRPEPVVETFSLDAYSRWQSPLTEFVRAPIASAMVEGTGGLVVEHEVVSVHGRDAKPCSTTASTEWHFAWGDTSVAARELLVFFNPFPDDAIVEGVFSTTDGIREPVRFEGFVVPGRGTVAVDLGDDVTRRSQVSATLRTRTGRVVVDRILRLNGQGGAPQGLTVQTGIPRPQGAWLFPDGVVSDSVEQHFTIYNPTAELAEVDIAFFLDDEADGSPEPVLLSIPPGGYEQVDVGSLDVVPDGAAHQTEVRSANGVPIVVEQTQFSSGEGRRGVSVTTGTPVESQLWFFGAGATTGTSDQWLVLVNRDSQVLAEVGVFAASGGQLVEVDGLGAVEVGPGERLAIRLGERISAEQLNLVVESSEPIVAARGLYRVADGRGVSSAIGVPGSHGLRPIVDPLDLDATFDFDPDGLDDPDLFEDPDPNAPPRAPDDVELPADETIVIDPDELDREADTGDGDTTEDETEDGDDGG